MESISPITVALPFAVYLIGWYACFHIALRGRRILRPLAIIPTLVFAIAIPLLLTDLAPRRSEWIGDLKVWVRGEQDEGWKRTFSLGRRWG